MFDCRARHFQHYCRPSQGQLRSRIRLQVMAFDIVEKPQLLCAAFILNLEFDELPKLFDCSVGEYQSMPGEGQVVPICHPVMVMC